MVAENFKLEELREKIDQIDDSLHQLIIKRMNLIEEVMVAKQDQGHKGLMTRPAREARVMRKLLKNNKGNLPNSVLFRIWREMMVCATALQGPVNVALCAPQKAIMFWDMARDHFGSNVAISLHQSTAEILRKIEDEPGVIGLTTLDQEREEVPWWVRLASWASKISKPRVIWRLPFFLIEKTLNDSVDLFAIASVNPESSGDDQALLVFDTTFDVSRSLLLNMLSEMGLPGQIYSVYEPKGKDRRQHLFELDGFVAEDDGRLRAASEHLGMKLDGISVLGSYPRPVKSVLKGPK